MNIGELAKRAGLTASAIRFYERAGLLASVERRPNGYRVYPPEAALKLNLIVAAQKAGFSLDEIRSLLPPDLVNWRHDAVLEALRRKVKDIEALQARLAQSRAHLVALIGEIEAKPGGIECSENARMVLARMLDGKLEQPQLAPADLRRLGKSAGRRRTS
ncbi:MAG: MerR family transcriptional regulator [Rhodoblastus sp.]